MQRTTIRLACDTCNREDYDGITTLQLKALEGWIGIERFQTYVDSCKTYDDPAKAPPGFDITAWYTHVGTCPECQKIYAIAE